MKIRDGYQKVKLAGETYIMPFGQNAADRTHSLKLNETSEFLWDALVKGADETQLVTLAAKEFEASEEDLPVLRDDIRRFISGLAANNIIILSDSAEPYSSLQPSYYQIGPLTFAYYGPEELYHRYFEKFACDPVDHADQKIYLRIGMPRCKENGTILIRTNELQICDAGSIYRFLFREDWGIYEMTIQKDGGLTIAYCRPDAFEEDHIEQIFHALRFGFLLLAQKHHLYALHSASILYRGKAWLFSGPSGTGKSTHTRLWRELLGSRAVMVNDDKPMLRLTDTGVLVCGTPYNGKHRLGENLSVPLKAVCILSRGAENTICPITAREGYPVLLQQVYRPANARALEQTLGLVDRLLGQVKLYRLSCTPELQAAQVAYNGMKG